MTFTTFDFKLQDEGSLVVLHPCNDAASEWIGEHIYTDEERQPQWWGGGIIIEPRYVQDIVDGITEAELTIGKF